VRYQLLGATTGLKVSSIALGTGLLGKQTGYGAEQDDIQRILSEYAEQGGNVIDTSDAYQAGAAEEAVGEFLTDRRNDIVLVTKFSRGAAPAGLAATGAGRKSMVQSVEGSLRRLKTDRVDLYMAHLDDGVTPIEEMVRGFDDLVRAGKIVYGGLSNFPAWRVATGATAASLRGWAPLAAIEVEYSLIARDAERELLPMADAFGMGVLAYSPLAAGLLTGKYRNGERGRATDFKASVPHDAESHTVILDVAIDVAREIGSDPGQVALAWIQSKGIIPIIGPRTPAQLTNNLAACSVTLDATQIERLNGASKIQLGYPHDLLAKGGAAIRAGVSLPQRTVGR
jgi:aryl-alcohol dehydrogenase-like predicted oxidoreductase